MSFEQGPYLNVAVFCENVIDDKTGVLSLIRIVDRLTVSAVGPSAPAEMPPTELRWKLVISIKSGSVHGTHIIRITPQLPSGATKPPMETSLHFEGANKGVNLVADIVLKLESTGVHWFLVHFDGELLTKIPAEVVYLVTRPPQAEAESNQT